jgi:glutamate/tyrosine decarboxylase-like PLP-dependent enzyme
VTISSEWRKALAASYRSCLEYLDSLDTAPAAAQATLEDLRAKLGGPLRTESRPPEQVIHELTEAVAGGIANSAGGRFFAWVVGGSLPAALAADWLTSTWDQNAALCASGPAAAVVEEVVGSWLKDLFHLPKNASFALVTGTQMGHVTCLAAARHAALARAGWDVEEKGLYGAPPITVLANGQKHGSVVRALRVLGMGQDYVKAVPTDSLGRIELASLVKELDELGNAPTIVILQAGDINTGAFDDFSAIIPIARERKAWIHVDGAFGIWAAVSPKYEHLLKGMEEANSWVTDAHKWLNVPYDSGFAFVADSEAHRASFELRASYLSHSAEGRDQITWTPEWSRRARGFPAYAALRQLGRDGLKELIERCCSHASDLVEGLGRLDGAEVVVTPIINQGLVRFLDPRTGSSGLDHDRHTDAVIASVVASGKAFFSGTTFSGRRAMRVSVCNWQTSDHDVARAVGAVATALKLTAASSTSPLGSLEIS